MRIDYNNPALYDRETLIQRVNQSENQNKKLESAYLEAVNLLEKVDAKQQNLIKENEQLKKGIETLQNKINSFKIKKKKPLVDSFVIIRLTPKEKETLISLSEKENKTMSAYIRDIVFINSNLYGERRIKQATSQINNSDNKGGVD